MYHPGPARPRPLFRCIPGWGSRELAVEPTPGPTWGPSEPDAPLSRPAPRPPPLRPSYFYTQNQGPQQHLCVRNLGAGGRTLRKSALAPISSTLADGGKLGLFLETLTLKVLTSINICCSHPPVLRSVGGMMGTGQQRNLNYRMVPDRRTHPGIIIGGIHSMWIKRTLT